MTLFPFLQTIEDALFTSTGSYIILGFVIMVFFIIAFTIANIDFKYSLMFSSILAIAFQAGGWFPLWIGVLAWIIIVAFGGTYLYQIITNQ